MYSKSSLIAIRFGLCKFIQFHRPELDIINGSNFKDANLVFKAKIVELKRLGKAKIEHKLPIVSEDLNKLYHSVAFDTESSIGLQNKVWFEVMLFFFVDVARKISETSQEIPLQYKWMRLVDVMSFK